MIKDINDIKECPDCASTNLVYSQMREQVICRECGLVYEPMIPLDTYEVPVTAKSAGAKKKAAKKKPKKKKAKTKAKKKAAKKKVKKKAAKKKPKKKAAKKKVVKKPAKKKAAKKKPAKKKRWWKK